MTYEEEMKNLTQDAPKRKIAVLHHSDADGFGAAYAIWKALNETEICDILFIDVQYGQDPPYEALQEFGPDKVFVVDFSYKADLLTYLNSVYPDLTVFNHHASALPELQAWCEVDAKTVQHIHPGRGSFFFSDTQSGCGLVWDMFHPDPEWDADFATTEELQPPLPMPEILHYVQDRDLWKFELEHSKEINAYIATLPFDFQVWDDFYTPLAYDCGVALLAFQERQVRSRLKDVRLIEVNEDDGYAFSNGNNNLTWFISPDASLSPTDCKKYFVPIVNASENISELGAAMNEAYPDAPFSVSYCDRAAGQRSFSLRSKNGFDVSEVAKAFGGGGHAAAAGFTLPSPSIF